MVKTFQEITFFTNFKYMLVLTRVTMHAVGHKNLIFLELKVYIFDPHFILFPASSFWYSPLQKKERERNKQKRKKIKIKG